MKELSQEKKERLFKTLFTETPFEPGECFKFKRGKLIWKVDWTTDRGAYIVAIDSRSYQGRYIYPRDLSRLTAIPKEELMKWVLRNDPFGLRDFIKLDKKTIKLLRKIHPFYRRAIAKKILEAKTAK